MSSRALGGGKKSTRNGSLVPESGKTQMPKAAPLVPERSIVVAAVENRAREVGFAVLSTSDMSLRLHQYIERQRYHTTRALLNVSNMSLDGDNCEEDGAADGCEGSKGSASVTILLCGAKSAVGALNLNRAMMEACESEEDDETKIVTNEATVRLMDRNMFDDSAGAMLLKTLASNPDVRAKVEEKIASHYLSIAAAAAIFNYLEYQHNKVLKAGSLNIKFIDLDMYLNMDSTTIRSLKLLNDSNAAKETRASSLYSLLKANVRTIGGAKLLRANIAQPPRDIYTISARLDVVEELTSNEALLFNLIKLVSQFPKDLERVITGCFAISTSQRDRSRRIATMLKNILRLKDALDVIEPAASSLDETETELLQTIRQICSNRDLASIREKIVSVIDPSAQSKRNSWNCRVQQCMALKPGLNGMLDTARQGFHELTEAIHGLAAQYKEQYEIPSLKLGHSTSKMFYLTFKQSDAPRTQPIEFTLMKRAGTMIHGTTQDLLSLNMRLQQAFDDCIHITDSYLTELMEFILQKMDALANVNESLSLLDMLLGFATLVISASGSGEYVRPSFSKLSPIAIQNARHPLLDPLGDEGFVSNSFYLSKFSSMAIIHGANMAGKTTYATTVAVLCVMAHIGCYVPASFATFFPVDHILTKLSHNDNPQMNASSFMAEMMDCASIIDTATRESLVIIDELGRSTSSIEGTAIAWAVLEELVCRVTPTLCVTHMPSLSLLAAFYPTVRNVHMQVGLDRERNRIDFKYRLSEGPLEDAFHYGISLAMAMGLPQDLTKEAMETATVLEDGHRNLQAVPAEESEDNNADVVCLRVAQRLEELTFTYQRMNAEELRTQLQEFSDILPSSVGRDSDTKMEV